MTLKELAIELDARWAYYRRECLDSDDMQWRHILAGQARAYADALQLVEKMLSEQDNADV